MQIQFNTGRQYSVDGQIIQAVLTPANILFNDLTRGISGWFPRDICPEIKTESQFKSQILSLYDKGGYNGISESYFYEHFDQDLYSVTVENRNPDLEYPGEDNTYTIYGLTLTKASAYIKVVYSNNPESFCKIVRESPCLKN